MKFFLAILLAMLFVFCASAQQVKLTWDPSPAPNITNYWIYSGTNGAGIYSNKTAAGTNCLVTISDMRPASYWFAVTAQDTNGAESGFSNEASWKIPAAPSNLTLLILQYGSVVAGITNDVGFFRLKIGQ